MKSELERLLKWIGDPKNKENRALVDIEKDPSLVSSIVRFNLLEATLKLWVKYYFVDNDLGLAKQYQYVYGRLVDWLASRSEFGEKITSEFGNGPSVITLSILLSDSKDLKERLCAWNYNDKYQGRPVVGLGPFIRSLLLGDEESAKLEIEKYKALSHRYGRASFEYALQESYLYERDAELMSSMLLKDSAGVTEVLMYILRPDIIQKRIYGGNFLSKYIAIQPATIIKTMHIIGLDLSLDHHLIPEDLMPVAPLQLSLIHI